jgi:hypothetical protein
MLDMDILMVDPHTLLMIEVASGPPARTFWSAGGQTTPRIQISMRCANQYTDLI